MKTAIQITLESPDTGTFQLLLILGVVLLIVGTTLFLFAEEPYDTIGFASLASGVMLIAIQWFNLANTSSHQLNERQALALEQQLGYTEVVISDGTFTASDDGRYVKGLLLKADDLTYYILLDED